MANARELLRRRKSVQSTGKITRTMELVAAAKLKKAQDAAAAAAPFVDGLHELMCHLAAASSEQAISHPLMERRERIRRVALLLACSDRGLCGPFNSALVRVALDLARAHRGEGREVVFIPLAVKGTAILRFFGEHVDRAYHGLVERPSYAGAERVLHPLIDRFQAGTFDLVEVVYSRFLSRARQVPHALTLLPVGSIEAEAIEPGGITAEPVRPTEYLYHPRDPAALLAALVPQALRTSFYSCLLQTAAGEHAARRMAMKNASDAADDIVKSINRRYNRARQGRITQEIAEIVGAVEAMK